MASRKRLGINFSEKWIHLVEVDKQNIVNSLEINTEETKKTNEDALIPEKLKIGEAIQSGMQKNNIETNEVNVSLPTKDIILRSFFIPWMSANEVKGVVEFEAKRYIPFKLENLSHTYYSHTMSAKQTKKIQILFVAIRKETLENYMQILNHSGLQIAFIEPAIISMLRLLTYAKHLDPKQKTAIIQRERNEGAIIILDQSIPQFVRDFKIAPLSEETSSEALNISLAREVKISLDYFVRQHKQGNVDRIFIVATEDGQQLADKLKKDLDIEAQSVDPQSLINISLNRTLGSINAYGTAVKNAIPFPVSVNLAPKTPEHRLDQLFDESPINYRLTAKFAAVCGFILLLVFILSRLNVNSYKKRADSLKNRLDFYETMTVEELEARKKDLRLQLESYQRVRLNSNLTYFLNRIPQLLPQGVWLKDLRIAFSDETLEDRPRGRGREKAGAQKSGTRISITMSGYAYSIQEQQQVDLVYQLIRSLKMDDYFSEAFGNINLVSVNKATLEEFNITEFRISLN